MELAGVHNVLHALHPDECLQVKLASSSMEQIVPFPVQKKLII